MKRLFKPETYEQNAPVMSDELITEFEKMLIEVCKEEQVPYTRSSIRAMLVSTKILLGTIEKKGITLQKEQVLFAMSLEVMLVRFQDRIDKFNSKEI